MEVEKTALLGVMILTPDVFPDERGFFMETFQEKRYAELVPGVRFVQDNLSRSKKNVLRGLHFQALPFAQGKLVQVLEGSVRDVIVDIRKGSPSYGKHVVIELSAENHRQVYVPEGCAHGFVALDDATLFAYKCTNVYSKEHDRGLRWNDPDLGIDWGVSDPIVSEKDQKHPLFKEL